MKKVVVVFPRDRYFSSASGALQITLMDQKWMTVLGGADSIRFELTTYFTSSATARILFNLSEGTKVEARPSMNPTAGVALTSFPSGSPTPAPTVGAVPVQVNGPFGGVLDVVLQVWDSAGTPELVSVEAELRATLFYND